VPANWNDLVKKCAAQDEALKRRYTDDGRRYYDIISENLDGYAGIPSLTRRWTEVYTQEAGKPEG